MLSFSLAKCNPRTISLSNLMYEWNLTSCHSYIYTIHTTHLIIHGVMGPFEACTEAEVCEFYVSVSVYEDVVGRLMSRCMKPILWTLSIAHKSSPM